MKTYPRLTREATSLTTPGATLAKLSRHRSAHVAGLAEQNPNLPGDVLREHLSAGRVAAWSNPAVTLMLLEEPLLCHDGARHAAYDPRLDRAAQPAVFAVVRGWWAETSDSLGMLDLLCHRGARDKHGAGHRIAVLALCKALRTLKHDDLHPTLEAFELWAHDPGLSHPPTRRRMELPSINVWTEARALNLFLGTMADEFFNLADPLLYRAGSLTLTTRASLAPVIRAAVPDPVAKLPPPLPLAGRPG